MGEITGKEWPPNGKGGTLDYGWWDRKWKEAYEFESNKEWPDDKWRGCGPSGTGGGVDD